MIKKTFAKAAVGTATVGALVLPAAVTVAPSFEMMACAYPNSVTTATDVQIQDPLVRPRSGVEILSITTAEDGKDPNGEVELRVTAPSGKRYATKSKRVGDGERAWIVNAPGVRGNREKTMKVVVIFRGGCKFKDSAGVAYFVVSR